MSMSERKPPRLDALSASPPYMPSGATKFKALDEAKWPEY